MSDFDKAGFETYLKLCAACLARAHARAGDAAAISGHVGKGEPSSRALADFTINNADQAEQDYEALVEAINPGRLTAESGI